MEIKYLPVEIDTLRLVLKKTDVSLAEQIFDSICEDRERLSKFMPWPSETKTLDDEIKFTIENQEDWDNFKAAGYVIFNKEGEHLGNIGAFNFDLTNESCEIGYWILARFEGNGFIQEATTALEKELFEAGFNRIVITCERKNIRSGNIPKRLGYSYEGELREVRKTSAKYVSLEVYSKLKREFEAASRNKSPATSN